MGVTVDLRVLELLCGRLCHELVGPVGAINNGVELLDEDDPGFAKEAIGLIGQSARKAAQRLQFYRFAYGTAGAGAALAASSIDGHALASALLEGGKIECKWTADARALALDWQRLACNMLVVGAEALPRGGSVRVQPPSGGRTGIEVVAEGDGVGLGAELRAALGRDTGPDTGPDSGIDALTARTVHAFYTARLAEHMGAQLTLAPPEPGRVTLAALR